MVSNKFLNVIKVLPCLSYIMVKSLKLSDISSNI